MVRRIYTMHQIAVNYVLDKISKLDYKYTEPMFWDVKKKKVRFPRNAKKIHGAYRGGWVRAWRTGYIPKATLIDYNSLYTWMAMKMKMPDLRSEQLVYHNENQNKESINECLSQIGVSRCMLYNKNNDMGLIPVRTDTGNYTPGPNKYIIGTYTHKEINKALDEGYKLVWMDWSINYLEAPNPFTVVFPKIYEKRKLSPLHNYFFKNIPNGCIGKFAQTKVGQELVFDDVDKCEQYLMNNYEVVRGVGRRYMYKKDMHNVANKPYYMPIVPVMVNAEGRMIMYDLYKRFNKRDRDYTDTDSLMFTGEMPKGLDIGDGLGQLKIEFQDEEAMIYGRKTYCIGDEVKLSGIHKRDIEKEDFMKGQIKYKEMLTIKTAEKTKDVGKFVIKKRDLNEQLENHKEINRLLDDEYVYVDNDITDINKFVEHIN